MSDLIFNLLILALVAGIAGYTAGLFGIGGGAFMVPALFFAFRSLDVDPTIVMHCAVATSASVIIFNGWRSVRSHMDRGSVDMSILWPSDRPWASYGLWIALGSFLAAAFLAPRLSSQSLTLIFSSIAFLVAAQFIFGRPDFVIRSSVPKGAGPPIIGGSIGALSSIMGIGGGSLSVPFLTLFGVPVHKAIGTAAGFGLMIAIPATFGFIISGWGVDGRWVASIGYVNLPASIFILSFAWLLVPLGTASAHKLDAMVLRRVFGVVLALIALNMVRIALSF